MYCVAKHNFTYREVHQPSCADWLPFLKTKSRRPTSIPVRCGRRRTQRRATSYSKNMIVSPTTSFSSPLYSSILLAPDLAQSLRLHVCNVRCGSADGRVRSLFFLHFSHTKSRLLAMSFLRHRSKVPPIQAIMFTLGNLGLQCGCYGVVL